MAKKTLANQGELERLAEELDRRRFPRLALFADTIGRYVDTQLKDSASWLEMSMLSFLVVRGGAMTPTKLAYEMLRSKHSMTRLIDHLEEEGMVVRDRAGDDRRSIQIRVTVAGLDYMREFLQDIDFIERKLQACLDEGELDRLMATTKKIRRALIDSFAS